MSRWYLSSFHTLISCCDTVQICQFIRCPFHKPTEKTLICVRRDYLEAMECAHLFQSTNLKSGSAVLLAEMTEGGKYCHSATWCTV
jgi:hypothetical protein